jgi:branched-chain amino acid transport system ATP-binding protein
MLRIDQLVVSYQHLKALRNVSLEVRANELVALIGSNGAGKTTLLNTISGLLRCIEGSITLDGLEFKRFSPDQICALGIIQVPEGRKLFPKMTVLENLQMGAYLPGARAIYKTSLQKVFDLFPRLAERRNQSAGSLSGGEQQMCALGRAIMASPKILMLDEPSLGLAPIMASEIFRIIDSLHVDGLTVLLVSQEITHALQIADRAYLLENGKIQMEGAAGSLMTDAGIRASYLGL